MSPESSSFRNLIISSGRYGLTAGGKNAEKIELTDIGLSITVPRVDEEKSSGLRKALLFPDLFREFFNQFDNHKLPSKEMLANNLVRDFKVNPLDKVICAEMIVKNATELGIITSIKGSEYIQLDRLGKAEPKMGEDTEAGGQDDEKPQYEDEVATIPTSTVPAKAVAIVKPTIFISHSKNIKILEQIKQVLSFGQFDFNIAIEKETTAIPIPEKIFELMRSCNCALINVSADEQEKRPDGTYGINPNVLIEIGGAFLTYDKRVVLLVDKRVRLPSNLQGLYRCEYEGDELAWETGMKLQKGLSGFRDMLQRSIA